MVNGTLFLLAVSFSLFFATSWLMAQGTPLLMMEWDLLSRRSYRVDNGAAELELNKELRWKSGIWNVHSSYYMGNVRSLDNKMDKLVVVIQTQSEYWLASQTCKNSWTNLSTWKKSAEVLDNFTSTACWTEAADKKGLSKNCFLKQKCSKYYRCSISLLWFYCHFKTQFALMMIKYFTGQ